MNSESGIERTAHAKDSFDEQFRRVHTMNLPRPDGTPGVDVGITLVRPEKPKEGLPVFFAPSWSMTVKDIYGYALRELYDSGRSIITCDPVREGGEPHWTETESRRLAQLQALDVTLPPEELRAAHTLIRVLEHVRPTGQKTNVLGHSRGFGYAVIAAALRPDLIANVQGYGPAGLIGKDSFLSIAMRLASQDPSKIEWEALPTSDVTLRQLAEAKLADMPGIAPENRDTERTRIYEDLRAKKEAAAARGLYEYAKPTVQQREAAQLVGGKAIGVLMKYIFSPLRLGRIWRAAKEAWGLSRIRVDALLPELRKAGVGVAIATGEEDSVFAADRVREHAGTKAMQEAGVFMTTIQGEHGLVGEDRRAVAMCEGTFTMLEHTQGNRAQERLPEHP